MGATNESWESAKSLSLIVLNLFWCWNVLSLLVFYLFHFDFFSSRSFFFSFQSCHSDLQPYLKSPEPANVDWKGRLSSGSWNHPGAKPLVAGLPINLNLANGTQRFHSWLAGGLRTRLTRRFSINNLEEQNNHRRDRLDNLCKCCLAWGE